MDTTTNNFRRRWSAPLRLGLALFALIVLLSSEVSSQESPPEGTPERTTTTSGTTTSTPPATAPAAATNLDTIIARLKQIRDAATGANRARIDSTINALLPPPNPLLLRGVRAIPDLVRGTTENNLVTLKLNREPTEMPKVVLTAVDTTLPDSIFLTPEAVLDSQIVIRAPKVRGLFNVNVYSDTDTATIVKWPQQLNIENIWRIVGLALLPIAVLVALVYMILKGYARSRNRRDMVLGLLLYEAQNQTYSLSRAQFILWMIVLTFSYVFIFFARGLVENRWEFPPLAGFAWTFIISLGTLIGAQATTAVRGAKGAGQVHPSLADLFVHGGVMALERVQQMLWTLISVFLFVYILIKNYSVTTELPTIPEQLLYLMGISSAGYLTGKALRKPGPVINQVAFTNSAPTLVIKGRNLYNNAFIWVDGVQLPGNATPVIHDADAEPEFASSIMIPLTAGQAQDAPLLTESDWYGRPRSVVVVNADGQRAEWGSTPVIVSATLQGALLTVTTQYVSPNGTWTVNGKPVPLKPTQGDADSWTYSYPAGEVPTSITSVTVNTDGVTVTYPPLTSNASAATTTTTTTSRAAGPPAEKSKPTTSNPPDDPGASNPSGPAASPDATDMPA